MSEDVQPWIDRAEDDLRSAEVLFGANIWTQTCFHAQQCVEKLLKALLIANGRMYPKTHNIADLLTLLGKNMPGGLATIVKEVVSLDAYYVPARYPEALAGALPYRLPEQDDAVEALALARHVAEIVKLALQ